MCRVVLRCVAPCCAQVSTEYSSYKREAEVKLEELQHERDQAREELQLAMVAGSVSSQPCSFPPPYPGAWAIGQPTCVTELEMSLPQAALQHVRIDNTDMHQLHAASQLQWLLPRCHCADLHKNV